MIARESRILVCSEPIDMRLGFDRLAAAVRERLAEEPGNGALFVFANRRATQLKILWFDRNGYCLVVSVKWCKKADVTSDDFPPSLIANLLGSPRSPRKTTRTDAL